ncbi:MAG TPA: GlsB/YeaQ/YmgE family stress response membrane protein [Fredinandcohnia sp.]|nr:GlsB/YeaQ/YmgE family stress response membrane protein [Fredinandcohnia sp.]
MSIFVWIIIGLLAGLIARAIMPGEQPGGVIVTILLGIGGAFLGGWLGSAIVGKGLTGFSFWSLLLAVVGALILLFAYQMITGAMRRRRHGTV